MVHFEELWEACEKLHTDKEGAVVSIVEEINMKLNLYKAVELKKEIPANERAKVKSRIMGEILLSLTHLSLKDNINVFESLSLAQQFRSLET